MDIFTFDKMRKQGIRIVGEEFANKVIRILEPRGLSSGYWSLGGSSSSPSAPPSTLRRHPSTPSTMRPNSGRS